MTRVPASAAPRVRKSGTWLKTTLVTAAWAAVRFRGSYLQAQFFRLTAVGQTKAVLAVAASMLTAAYFMLCDGVPYHDRPALREGKPKDFFYLDHRTVDGRCGIITDTYATPANVHDSIVYLGRLDRQVKRFGFAVAAAGLDAGYATPGIAKGLEARNVRGVIGYRNPTPPKARQDEEERLRL